MWKQIQIVDIFHHGVGLKIKRMSEKKQTMLHDPSHRLFIMLHIFPVENGLLKNNL